MGWFENSLLEWNLLGLGISLIKFTKYEDSTDHESENVNKFSLVSWTVLDISDRLDKDLDISAMLYLLLLIFFLIGQYSLRSIPILGSFRTDHLKQITSSSKKELMKENRSFFEREHSATMASNKAAVAQKCNGVSLMASNCYDSLSLLEVKWLNIKNKVVLDKSYIVHKYNNSKSGTD